MVKNLSSATISTNTFNKVGTTQDGRSIYMISDSTGQKSVKVSVAAKDCDTFERVNQTIAEATPKYQKYAETMTPEKMEKNKKKAKWLFGIPAALGFLLPAILVRPKKGWISFKQVLATIGGTVAGFAAGGFLASKTITPPGLKEISQASHELSKLDIKPIE